MNAVTAELGLAVTGPQYIAATEAANDFSRRVASWWTAGTDVLVTPTIPHPPFRLGA